jgi:HprK-related kinase A
VYDLLRSFPPRQDAALPPDVTLSLVVAPPSKNRVAKPFHFLYREGHCVGRTIHTWQLFRYLETQLDVFLAESMKDFMLLHAGAVSRNGAGIILPGPSGSGKSSLTLALVRGGYCYLSDEFAVVEPSTGAVHAFPKPISIKNTSVFPELSSRKDLWFGPEENHEEAVWYIHPEDVVPNSLGRQVPIRYIVFPRYDASVPLTLQSISPSLAVRELINNSVNFSSLGKGGLHALARLVKEAECYTLSANGLEPAIEVINELTEG